MPRSLPREREFLGGARVQYDLRKVMLFLNAMPLIKPEVFIGGATAKFDATTGRCTDEGTRRFVSDQMSAFARWIVAVAFLAWANVQTGSTLSMEAIARTYRYLDASEVAEQKKAAAAKAAGRRRRA